MSKETNLTFKILFKVSKPSIIGRALDTIRETNPVWFAVLPVIAAAVIIVVKISQFATIAIDLANWFTNLI
jgi:hypothetical protein